MYFRLGTSNGIGRTFAGTQAGSHASGRRASLRSILLAALTACALAFAVGSRAGRRRSGHLDHRGAVGHLPLGLGRVHALLGQRGGATFECSPRRRRLRACALAAHLRGGQRLAPARGPRRRRRRHARPDPGGAHLVGRRQLPERQLRDRRRRLDQPGLHGTGLRLERAARSRWWTAASPGGKKAGRFTASGVRLARRISTSPDPSTRSARRDLHRPRIGPRRDAAARTICLRLREYQPGTAATRSSARARRA